VDFIDEFCDAELCYAKRNDMSLYRDVHHISDVWALTLQPKLEEAIFAAMPEADKLE